MYDGAHNLTENGKVFKNNIAAILYGQKMELVFRGFLS